MIGSRAWFALMRRNMIYRKRNWLGSIFELVLPFFFVWVLVKIRDVTKINDPDRNPELPEYYPDDYQTLIPMSFDDHMIAFQSQRICLKNRGTELGITGIHDHGFNWQVPFIRCDVRHCQYLGQDAYDFCEYYIMVVTGADVNDVGGRERAVKFKQYVYNRWPEASRERNTTHDGMPFNYDFIQLWSTSDEIDKYIARSDYGTPGVPKIGMGIVFDGNSNTDYKYWIRQNSTNMNAPTKEVQGRPMSQTTPPTDRLFNSYARTDYETCTRTPNDPYIGKFADSCTGQYLYNGVIAIQRLISDFILYDTGSENDGYFVAKGGVQIVQFPQNSFFLSGFFKSVELTAPLLLVLGLLYPVASMIGSVVREKQLRQKELMKMMSVTESDIGWSWFISFAIFHFISATFAAFMSSRLYENSSASLLWLFWLLTFCSVIVFSMAVSAITSKTVRAVLIGLLVFFAGAFLVMVVDFETGNKSVLALVNLHPVSAFSYGIRIIGALEDRHVGLVGNTLDFSEGRTGYSFQSSLQYLMIDCILWGFLAFYLTRVVPPDYGQGLPAWFIFDPAFWCPGMYGRHIENEDDDPDASSVRSQADMIPIEPVGDLLKRQTEDGESIEIHNLRKKFGEHIAVDGLSLSMYSNQITALLGHNGAGKTTTISMLTGALAVTSGKATIMGKDIRTDINEIRQEMGICLQHDCLFPQLTVKEHLQFFARLKGLYNRLPYSEAEQQVEESIRDVALGEKCNTLSKNLSGGMKRKLSVAIAFCGGSQVVLLDEPTSGMDPFSRRFTWDVIRHYRQGRCIILTTHFMDEADLLSDRIAIMADGQLRCVGSPLYLKKTFGVGYQLTIERKQHDNKVNKKEGEIKMVEDETKSDDDDSYDSPGLGNLVSESVPEASLLSDVGSEISFRLPISAASKFPALFGKIEEHIDNGEVTSYGVSITTLNEVFLLVAHGYAQGQRKSLNSPRSNDQKLPHDLTGETQSMDEEYADEPLVHNQYSKPLQLENDRLFSRHLMALLRKRGLYFRRDKKAWLCTTVVPSLFVLIGFIIFVVSAPMRNLQPLKLDLKDYNKALKPQENVITFNSPQNRFLCQPGICSHRQPFVEVPIGNERYLFCGYESKLLNFTRIPDANDLAKLTVDDALNRECTVTGTYGVVDTLSIDVGVVVDEAGVENVTQGSQYLLGFDDAYAASRYGAIWFTHDQTSYIDGAEGTMFNSSYLYNETVVQQCQYVSDNFGMNYTSDCKKFGGVGYVIQYNFTAIHSVLLYEKLANEALVRHATGDPSLKVEATIAPLPITSIENTIGAGEDAFAAWFLVVLSFPFIAGAYASFVVSEKISKAKHLQTVAGVEPVAYWFSTFIWDTINYQMPLWVAIILMFAFKVDILTTSDRDVFSGIFSLLFLFGPATAGFTYCVSFAFNSPSMCNIFVIIFGFLIGMGGPLTCFILVLLARDANFPNPSLEDIANILTWVLRCTPSFCLGSGLFRVINIDTFLFLEGDDSLGAWTAPILLHEVYFLAAQCIVFLVLAIHLDKWSTNPRMMSIWRRFVDCIMLRPLLRAIRTQAQKTSLPPLPDDDDVLAEEEVVLSGQASGNLIVMDKLRKVYDDGKVAVDGLSLSIPPGECFGLLGINGAGKTTTMGMLTAEFPPTGGDAFLAGISVTKEPQKIRRRIGYCPQFDAHFPNLTGREHVELYASIKGIPMFMIDEVVDKKLREVGLNEVDSNRMSSGYSGGMRRRLSLACATIGQPRIIFLDECSTGVDPIAKRDIWQMVCNIVAGRGLSPSERPSIILTTHSMDECEALCPRIGIMANGKLRCLGSAQHLKTKFGQGFQVEINVLDIERDDEDFVEIGKKLEESSGNLVDDLHFNLQECEHALRSLTGDDTLYNMIHDGHGAGYIIWKDANTHVGVPLTTLTEFATKELRMAKVEEFISENFENHVLRERQDTKVRYEVSGESIKISTIFSSIEDNKVSLRLADYSVSQTSLEQVFNMHAAEAERRKKTGLQRSIS